MQKHRMQVNHLVMSFVNSESEMSLFMVVIKWFLVTYFAFQASTVMEWICWIFDLQLVIPINFGALHAKILPAYNALCFHYVDFSTMHVALFTGDAVISVGTVMMYVITARLVANSRQHTGRKWTEKDTIIIVRLTFVALMNLTHSIVYAISSIATAFQEYLIMVHLPLFSITNPFLLTLNKQQIRTICAKI